MNLEEYEDFVKSNMNHKNINQETQQYIIQYIKLNKDLFGNCINIDKLAHRIVNNLDYSITYIDRIDRIITYRGKWIWYNHKIAISPISKLESVFFKRQKELMDSTIRHEIDHCATTEYIDIDEKQKEEFIKENIKRTNIKGIYRQNTFRNYINNRYKKQNGQIAMSGIHGCFRKEKIRLIKLNEGITAYKQELYDKALGIKSKTFYTSEKQVASFIASIIGREELISMHFDNNYEGIRDMFNKKTGKELNELVKTLNSKSRIPTKYTYLFGKIYTYYFNRKLQKAMKQYEIINSDNSENQGKKSNREKEFKEELSKDAPLLEKQKSNSIKFQEKIAEASKENEVVNDREEK